MRTEVTFTYKNYRGETSVRLVRPIMVSFGTTGFHPEPQWLLHGWDINKDAERTFAMENIKDWEASAPVENARPADAALADFVRAYELQDADNFTDEMRNAYATASALVGNASDPK